MTAVEIQRDLKDRLSAGGQPVQLRDEEGHLVGFFVPADSGDVELWERARSAFTEEEIQQARQETGGQPLSEILDELEQRWPSR